MKWIILGICMGACFGIVFLSPPHKPELMDCYVETSHKIHHVRAHEMQNYTDLVFYRYINGTRTKVAFFSWGMYTNCYCDIASSTETYVKRDHVVEPNNMVAEKTEIE